MGKGEKQLLFSITKADFEFQTFRSGGPGGQNQNKVSSGVRIIHKASGATAESRTSRSQLENKKLAFQRLVDSKPFQVWLKLEIGRRVTGDHPSAEGPEEKVERQMAPANLKVEILENGEWTEEA